MFQTASFSIDLELQQTCTESDLKTNPDENRLSADRMPSDPSRLSLEPNRQSLDPNRLSVVPAMPLRRQSSLLMPGDNSCPREHVFVIKDDPGLTFAPMLDGKNAYVKTVDSSKSPAQLTTGMRLIRINRHSVNDMEFERIMELYDQAKYGSKPMNIKLVTSATSTKDERLSTCRDVIEALAWKKKMEGDHWNSSLKARAVVFVDGLKFQIFILLIIFFDLTLFFIEINEDKIELWITICSWIVMLFYIIEISIRMYGYGVHKYFHKRFCVFDFIIVLACLVMQVLSEASWVGVFRTVRVGKILLVFRAGARLFTGVGSRIPTAVRYKVRMNKMQFRGDFNLDLCYITKRIISMSVPAEGREKMFRNPIDKVVAFFEKMHRDKYMVYDLCEERTYDYKKFHGRVQPFKFTDHSVPTIKQMLKFCLSVKDWMEKDPENVIAVHCKGGKGRTGTMVCAWLVYCYRSISAQEAIDFFAQMRTNLKAGSKTQGIETSSQVRYVKYFWDFIHIHNMDKQIFQSPFGFNFRSIRIGPFYRKTLDAYQKFELEIFERSETYKYGRDNSLDRPDSSTEKAPNNLQLQTEEMSWPSLSQVSSDCIGFFAENHERTVEFNSVTSKCILEKRGKDKTHNQFFIVMQPKVKADLFKGNLRLDFFGEHKKRIETKRKWLSSSWICSNLHPLPGEHNFLTLTKFELDKIQKDKDHSKYPEDFRIELSINHTNSSTEHIPSFPSQNTLVDISSKISNASGSSATTFWQCGENAPVKEELELIEMVVK